MKLRSTEAVVRCPDCDVELTVPIAVNAELENNVLHVTAEPDPGPAWEHYETHHMQVTDE